MTKTISVLTVNAGSSSIKLGLFTVDEHSVTVIASVAVTGLGQTASQLRIVRADDDQSHALDARSHGEALQSALAALQSDIDITPHAVSYRLVHGGAAFRESCTITDDVVSEIAKLATFDPDHTPATLEIITALRTQFPDAHHVASFDTALFHDLPTPARLTTLPRKYEQLGLRRYGFHGLSYQYVLGEFARIAGDVAAHGRVVVAHLGSGASLAAFRDGKPLDVSMGFSPVSGIPMSTRSGDIDPGVVAFLRTQGIEGEAFDRMVNTQSGLLGVSELSADMLTLLQQSATNSQAADAVTLFCYQATKTIGAFGSVLDGVDSIIFTGGIGEQAPLIRSRICATLGYLGVEIDDEQNARHAALISSAASKVGVHVIPTDEAQILCRNAYTLQTTNPQEQS